MIRCNCDPYFSSVEYARSKENKNEEDRYDKYRT